MCRDASHWRANRSRSTPRLRRLLVVPPPHCREAGRAIFRQRIGLAEAVPPRSADLPVGPLRHDVMAPYQNTVEGPRGRHQLLAALGEDDPLDQAIHCWALDADIVLRAELI